MVELLHSGRLACAVHSVEIFRFKEGVDHVYLHTNLPEPRHPYVGHLKLHTMCDRGTGPDWVQATFPGVETHTYDHSLGRVDNGQNPARPLHLQTAEAKDLQDVA